MKKFEGLGKILGKEAQKKVLGGVRDDGGSGPRCNDGSECSCVIMDGEVTTTKYGRCAMSSTGTTIACYCDACEGEIVSNGGRSRCWSS